MQKEKIRLEYEFKNVSPSVLWNFLGTPSGLAEWFSDSVVVKGDVYSFVWNGVSQEAELLTARPLACTRFRWLEEKEKNVFFEFKIEYGALTGDISLVITDFVDLGETEDQTTLWNSQVENLKRKIGV